jgi:hypothetical protein
MTDPLNPVISDALWQQQEAEFRAAALGSAEAQILQLLCAPEPDGLPQGFAARVAALAERQVAQRAFPALSFEWGLLALAACLFAGAVLVVDALFPSMGQPLVDLLAQVPAETVRWALLLALLGVAHWALGRRLRPRIFESIAGGMR